MKAQLWIFCSEPMKRSPAAESRILIEPTSCGNLHGRLGMKSIFVTTVLWLTIASVAFGQTSKKVEQELLRTNREYDEALVRGDIVVLERLYSDEFVYTTPDGEVRDKTQQLAFTRTGDLRLESGQSDDVRVRVYGNTAVMTGRFTAKGKLKDKNISQALTECSRVLKVGGLAIFHEPVRVPVLDTLRETTFGRCLVPKEASLDRQVTQDERKLTASDLELIRRLDPELSAERFLLLSRIDRFIRNPNSKKQSFLEKMDFKLFRLLPFLKAYGGVIVLLLKNSRGEP